MEIEIQLQEKYQSLKEHLDERARRIWAATEARVIGRGGVSRVSRATGLARTVIYAGLRELDDPETVPLDRIRKAGGGRKQTGYHSPGCYHKVEGLVEPVIRGDPQSALRWTCKSVRKLSEELKREGISAGYQTVAKALHELGYTLQSTRKCISEGGDIPTGMRNSSISMRWPGKP
jgi:DNA-binding phage protein